MKAASRIEIRRDVDRDPITINQLFGQRASIGPIPASQFVPWILLGALVYFVLRMLLYAPLPVCAIVWIWLWLSYWGLTGDRDYRFFKRWGIPPAQEWVNSDSVFVPVTHPRWQQKVASFEKPIEAQTRAGIKKVMPFQKFSHIHSIVEIESGQNKFACLLLYNPLSKAWSAEIPFHYEGCHTQLYRDDVEAYLDNVQRCMSELPEGEFLTMRQSSRSDISRAYELDRLAQEADNAAISVFMLDEAERVKETTHQGSRQVWTQSIWATWTAQKSGSEKTDMIGKAVDSLGEKIQRFSRSIVGTDQLYFDNFYIETARKIFEYGYLPTRNLLETKARFKIKEMSGEDLWSWLWYQFNRRPYGEMPEIIRIRLDGVPTQNIPQAGQKDIISRLIQGEQGRSSCPKHRREKGFIYCNGKVGKLVVLEDAPKQWASGRAALRWVWDRISTGQIKDVDIITQISTKEQWIVKDEMEKMNRQSQHEQRRAIEEATGKMVYADRQNDLTYDALLRIVTGVKPLYCAPVLVVWRDNEQQCEEAVSRLCHSFEAVNAVVENDIAWRVWCESLPINDFPLLKSYSAFSDRRITVDSDTVVGFLPLTRPRELDKKGVEFVTEQGGSPIKIDLFQNTKRVIITGATGAGKSVVGWRFIQEAVALDIPVVGIDLSTGGNSTFQLAVRMLGEENGAYVNILQEQLNPLQPPDLRSLDYDTQLVRFKRWKDAVRQIVVSIAMDTIVDQALQTRVESLVVRLIEVFLSDVEMTERYNVAFEKGWKSPEWQQMPTLKDMLKFCSKEKLNLENYGEMDAIAINQIVAQVGAKLLDPTIGDMLGKPSSVAPKAKVTFYALSGLTNDSNSYVMALCGQMACLRVALEHSKSLLVADELSVLLGKRGFAEMIGEFFATGRKEGMSILVLLQDMHAIVNCSASAKIIENRDIILTGLTKQGATRAYVEHLNFPEDVIGATSTEKYLQNAPETFSHWLLESNGRFWEVRFYASRIMLAALANSDEEKLARERVLSAFPKTFRGYLLGLKAFAIEYVAALKGSIDIKEIGLTDYQKYDRASKEASLTRGKS